MAGVLDKVDQRTQLVGQNRLEILVFRLNGRQKFAINVFKVQEVLSLPALTIVPHSHPVIVGVMHLRNHTIPVMDLSMAVGKQPIKDRESAALIVTEYNNSVQAFLVGGVENIENLNWEEVLPPPPASGRDHYLTSLTRINDEIVEIIDVEKVLAQIVSFNTQLSDEVLDLSLYQYASNMEVLIVDDSSVGLAQVRETIGQLGLKIIEDTDGLMAYNRLKKWANEGVDVPKKLLMVITDAEMPEMDGYRLTAEIRNDPRLQDLFVVLHTSLSGSFNEAMVKKVGCDGFLSKFKPNELAVVVQERIRERIKDMS